MFNNNPQSSSGVPSHNSNNNPYLDYYQRWSDKTPIVTRTSMIAIVVLYLFSWIWDLTTVLSNTTYYTLFSFEIYRLILSPIVSNSLLSTVLIALFYPQLGSKLEYSIGSIGFLFLIGKIIIITNVTFVFICLCLYMFGMIEALFWNCAGFWTLIFGIITIDCMITPDVPRRMMCLPMDIPSKYFPLALYAFFCFFSGPVLSFLISIGVGYIYSQGYLDSYKPTIVYMTQQESPGGLFHNVTSSKGWIPASSAMGLNAYTAVSQGDGSEQGQQSSFPSTYAQGWQNQGTGDTGKKNKPKDPFQGPSNKLSSGSSAFSFGSSSSPESREAIAARRLQALGVPESPTSPSAPMVDNENNLRSLMEMGFSRDKAINALNQTGGSLDGAIGILTSNSF